MFIRLSENTYVNLSRVLRIEFFPTHAVPKAGIYFDGDTLVIGGEKMEALRKIMSDICDNPHPLPSLTPIEEAANDLTHHCTEKPLDLGAPKNHNFDDLPL